jgi:flagellar biosynthesis protein
MSEDLDSPSPFSPVKPISGHSVAVALKGDEENLDAPAKIVAAGRGKLAEQILELAFEKGIHVREDADLAELLAQLELDTPIPSEAIVAVAEILAKVYEANAAAAPVMAPAFSLDEKGMP